MRNVIESSQTLSRIDPDLMRMIGLFAGCSDQELTPLFDRLSFSTHGPRHELVGFLDESTDVYFVLEGKLRATIYSFDGRETILRDITAGEYFGELSAFDGLPRSASVVALSHCLVATMSAEEFRRFVTANPTVAAVLIRDLGGQVRELTERVFHLSTWTVRYRLFAELLKLGNHCEAPGPQVVIENFPTHGEIASKISTHREAVSKELSRLSKDGVVKQKGRTMVLMKPEVLADVLEAS